MIGTLTIFAIGAAWVVLFWLIGNHSEAQREERD